MLRLLCFGAGAVGTVLVLRYRRRRSAGGGGKNVLSVRIGTRKSDLAMIQTYHVESLLLGLFPDIRIAIQEGVSAHGDNVLDQSLKALAAKTPGLFTKELEAGLLMGQYDFVVHSLKDMPTTLPDGLVLAAITEREDPRDALVVHEKHRGKGGLAGLAHGAVVGTSSIRREAVLRRDYPHLKIKLIRGNVNTRLAKLDSGEYDAIILAVAGLVRLGKEFEARIEASLDPPQFMYGVGQGALGLQCRAGDEKIINMLKAIEHPDTAARCKSERSLLYTLQGGCQVPLGVYSQVDGDKLTLECTILSEDGTQSIQKSASGHKSSPEKLGITLANELIKGGAGDLLNSFRVGDNPRPLTYGSAEQPHTESRKSSC
mmetsp:Transcript_17590/g.28472  ORF Transcript_17590/g.28472 Transcript_17590/m.28472 type:complete len:372 (+) Transcript_17590:270-1385(+)